MSDFSLATQSVQATVDAPPLSASSESTTSSPKEKSQLFAELNTFLCADSKPTITTTKDDQAMTGITPSISSTLSAPSSLPPSLSNSFVLSQMGKNSSKRGKKNFLAQSQTSNDTEFMSRKNSSNASSTIFDSVDGSHEAATAMMMPRETVSQLIENENPSITQQQQQQPPHQQESPVRKKTLTFMSGKIKISNTLSKELKANDFRDDDAITLDAIQANSLAHKYNLEDNIAFSVKTIQPELTSQQQSNSWITLPVLLSLKTQERDLQTTAVTSLESPKQNVLTSTATTTTTTTTTSSTFFETQTTEKQPEYNSIDLKSRKKSDVESPAKQLQLSHRFPIDLICVIDTSGSMVGEPLNLLQETLLFIVDSLQPGDRMCLIQFSTNAKRLTPLLAIESNENIDAIKSEIRGLIAKGGTNMNQGMQIAFDVLKQRRQKNPITSVFLLSDGLSDGSEIRIKDSLKNLNFYENHTDDNFTIQTFGFGKDHDPILMDKISQFMDGNFYFIEDIHRIDECFFDALGGLFSVVSQNVAISIRVPDSMRDYVKISEVFGEVWQETNQAGTEYAININQLISGVSKDYVLVLSIDPKLLTTDNDTNPQNNLNQLLQLELVAKQIEFPAALESQVSSGSPVEQNSPEIINSPYQITYEIPESISKNLVSCDLIQSDIFEQQQQQQLQQQQQQLQVQQLKQQLLTSQDESQQFLKPFSITLMPTSDAAEEKSGETGKSSNSCTNNNSSSNNASSSQKIVKNICLNLSNPNCIDAKAVNEHYLRVRSANALEKCQAFAMSKKFEEGLDHATQILHELLAQPEETKHHFLNLIADLSEAKSALTQRITESFGWQRMLSCRRMHMEQRSAGIDFSYQNQLQKSMVSGRKKVKDNQVTQLLPMQEQLDETSPTQLTQNITPIAPDSIKENF